ncbi:MAG: VirB4 family type IV secretion/conjugal transfer ATPase, partial [Hydrogenophaga sp.]|nr:VirB4 family type IV secretion/conjugal transfer ATPase [Hydrogenophaga sp.]
MFDRSGGDALRRSGRTGRTGRPAQAAPNKAQPRHWTQALRENPLTRFVPFSSLVSEHDVITRGGDFMRVWRLDGVAFECADDHLIAERHEALCSLLRNLAGDQWAVWTHRLHRKVQDRLGDPPQPGFARDLSQAYQAKLGERAMMSNELYLTLVYRPNTSRISRALQSTQRSKAAIAAAHAEALR